MKLNRVVCDLIVGYGETASVKEYAREAMEAAQQAENNASEVVTMYEEVSSLAVQVAEDADRSEAGVQTAIASASSAEESARQAAESAQAYDNLMVHVIGNMSDISEYGNTLVSAIKNVAENGSDIFDVTYNGESVVNENGVAIIPVYESPIKISTFSGTTSEYGSMRITIPTTSTILSAVITSGTAGVCIPFIYSNLYYVKVLTNANSPAYLANAQITVQCAYIE